MTWQLEKSSFQKFMVLSNYEEFQMKDCHLFWEYHNLSENVLIINGIN